MSSSSSASNSASQSVKVWLDKNFLQTAKGAGEILTHLEKANITSIIEALPVENSVLWTRCASAAKNDTTEVQHDHILVKVEWEQFVEYAGEHLQCADRNNSGLVKYVNSIKAKAQVGEITFLIPGFKQFFKYIYYSFSE